MEERLLCVMRHRPVRRCKLQCTILDTVAVAQKVGRGEQWCNVVHIVPCECSTSDEWPIAFDQLRTSPYYKRSGCKSLRFACQFVSPTKIIQINRHVISRKPSLYFHNSITQYSDELLVTRQAGRLVEDTFDFVSMRPIRETTKRK